MTICVSHVSPHIPNIEYLDAYGGIWTHMEVFGDIWWYMRIFGGRRTRPSTQYDFVHYLAQPSTPLIQGPRVSVLIHSFLDISHFWKRSGARDIIIFGSHVGPHIPNI